MNASLAPTAAAPAHEFVLIPTKNRRGLQIALVVDRRAGELRLRRYTAGGVSRVPEFDYACSWTPLSMVVGRPESSDPRVVEAIALLTTKP